MLNSRCTTGIDACSRFEFHEYEGNLVPTRSLLVENRLRRSVSRHFSETGSSARDAGVAQQGSFPPCQMRRLKIPWLLVKALRARHPSRLPSSHKRKPSHHPLLSYLTPRCVNQGREPGRYTAETKNKGNAELNIQISVRRSSALYM